MTEPTEGTAAARWLYDQSLTMGYSPETTPSVMDFALKILHVVHAVVNDGSSNDKEDNNSNDGDDDSSSDSDSDNDSDSATNSALIGRLNQVVREMGGRNNIKGSMNSIDFTIAISRMASKLKLVRKADVLAAAGGSNEGTRTVPNEAHGGDVIGETEEIGADNSLRETQQEGQEGGTDDTTNSPQDDNNKCQSNSHLDIMHHSDEFMCYYLRVRVLGLSQPTFTKRLWKYLQSAGWTYVNGVYRIPKHKKDENIWTLDVEKMPEKFFQSDFNPGLRKQSAQSDEEEEQEEGPETFRSPNEIVDYLDQYCLPYPDATSAELKAQQDNLSSKSKAYERRCTRLRKELMYIAFLETKRHEREQRKRTQKVVEGSFSKYGHNHRDCDVCFVGAHELYHRVACRDCGLVVHTNCYGLVDHDDNSKNKDGFKKVDEKGFFKCDVCAVSLGGVRRSWQTVKDDPYRYHKHHPNAVCKVCSELSIAGGMKVFEGRGRGAKSSDIWVHLFCLDTLLPQGISSVVPQIEYDDLNTIIADALENASKRVEKVEAELGSTVHCLICANKKGDLWQCRGKCRRFFHQLCNQLDCVRDESVDKRTYCKECASSSGKPRDVASNKSSKRKAMEGTTEEINQYLGKNAKRKAKTVESNGITMPTARECADEVETVCKDSKMKGEYDKFAMQYASQFSEWSFALATDQSILLYGLGSKRKLLSSFGQYLSKEGDVVTLDGCNPGVDLDLFFHYLKASFLGGEDLVYNNTDAQSMKRRSTHLAKMFGLKRSRPLFILIHNIDGIGLRHEISQDLLANFKLHCKDIDGSPMVRIVATVDNVSASLTLWNPLTEHDFNWTWKQVSTYEQYFEEIKNGLETSTTKKAKKTVINESYCVAVDKVLATLAPRQTQVFQVLAKLQNEATSEKVTIADWKKECKKKMLPSGDQELRVMMNEFIDHMLLKSIKDADGTERVTIPHPREQIQEIIDFKRKA